jgi:hypothetical protein
VRTSGRAASGPTRLGSGRDDEGHQRASLRDCEAMRREKVPPTVAMTAAQRQPSSGLANDPRQCALATSVYGRMPPTRARSNCRRWLSRVRHGALRKTVPMFALKLSLPSGLQTSATALAVMLGFCSPDFGPDCLRASRQHACCPDRQGQVLSDRRPGSASETDRTWLDVRRESTLITWRGGVGRCDLST